MHFIQATYKKYMFNQIAMKSEVNYVRIQLLQPPILDVIITLGLIKHAQISLHLWAIVAS